MLLPALLLAAAALAAHGRPTPDVNAGSDVLAEVLRADLRRNNDDYADARRLSAYVSPAKSFVPKSKYVRLIQNESQHSGLHRRSANNNITGEGEEKPVAEETEENKEGQVIGEKVEGVGVYRRETGELGKETGSEGLKTEKEEKIREKKEVIKGEGGKKIEHLGENLLVTQGVGEGSSRATTRTTPRAAPSPTPRRRLPTPRPAGNASTAKKRYEVRTRTPADPQQQYFKNESESIEKFNSLSSVRAPKTEFTMKRSVATTRRTMKQIVSSVRASGVTAMRASRDSRKELEPRRARSRAREARKVKAAWEKRKVQKARAAREAREMQSRNRHPHLRQGPDKVRPHSHVALRTQQLHVDPALKQLREDMRAGGTPPSQKPLPLQLLDMAPARGPRVHARRLRDKLCDRYFLRPEGPKYDSQGRIYAEKFAPRGRGNYGFDQTKAPRLVLPRCCNCCRKSVLGCE